MTAKLIHPTDPIEVHQICLLAYGQPGSRKSSMAQTGDDPFTIATDPGIYRAYGRKLAVVVETWPDVLDACKMPECEKAKTIVVDTLGMALEKLGATIIGENPKNGNRMGGLSLQGYGVLKSMFAQWVGATKQKGKDLVFLCHEKVEKNGDDAYYCPDIVGGSYNTIMNVADAVGYLHFDGGKKVIDFTPTDRWMAKCPPCGWTDKDRPLPDFGTQPAYLGGLLSRFKESMGRISEESAKIAGQVEEWKAWLATDPNLEAFNGKVTAELGKLPAGVKAQVWSLVCQHAERVDVIFDAKSKVFKTREAA